MLIATFSGGCTKRQDVSRWRQQFVNYGLRQPELDKLISSVVDESTLEQRQINQISQMESSYEMGFNNIFEREHLGISATDKTNLSTHDETFPLENHSFMSRY